MYCFYNGSCYQGTHSTNFLPMKGNSALPLLLLMYYFVMIIWPRNADLFIIYCVWSTMCQSEMNKVRFIHNFQVDDSRIVPAWNPLNLPINSQRNNFWLALQSAGISISVAKLRSLAKEQAWCTEFFISKIMYLAQRSRIATDCTYMSKASSVTIKFSKVSQCVFRCLNKTQGHPTFRLLFTFPSQNMSLCIPGCPKTLRTSYIVSNGSSPKSTMSLCVPGSPKVPKNIIHSRPQVLSQCVLVYPRISKGHTRISHT